MCLLPKRGDDSTTVLRLILRMSGSSQIDRPTEIDYTSKREQAGWGRKRLRAFSPAVGRPYRPSSSSLAAAEVPASGPRAVASERNWCRRTTRSVVVVAAAGSAGLSCARSPRNAACCAQTPPGSWPGRCSATAAYRPRPAPAVPVRTSAPAGCSSATGHRPGRS